MKTLATHHNPHLDDVCGIWLLNRFHPAYKRAKVAFVNQASKIDEEKYIGIGIGRGKFDEHKGDLSDCASTLVYKEVKKQISSALTKKALELLVDYVNKEDHASFMGKEAHIFTPPFVLLGHSFKKNSSNKVLLLGFEMLDALFEVCLQYAQLEKDARKAKTFETKWGKGIGLETTVQSSIVGEWAYAQGVVLYAVVNKRTKYRLIKAVPSGKEINLTESFAKATKKEPKSSWFLHHSKRMLLCGSDVAKNHTFSKMNIQTLISLVSV